MGSKIADVPAWRITTRKSLLEERSALSKRERVAAQASVSSLLLEHARDLAEAAIGFYWPIRGEIDLRPLVVGLVAAGADAALPVVVAKDQPLEFWEWQPDTPMSRGNWNIPVPATRKQVQPTVLLIPLLGFDEAGYRLGYGGGYYDRTLAALRLKPVTIGVGYERGRLQTIHPQPHDVPLDAIVTETGFTGFGESGCASSPCMLRDFD
jgi:5-formyltetrahydrofolate cyclo-ligase